MKPRLSPGHISIPVCKPDFDVWDHVLSRFWKRGGGGYGRLESFSRESDRRDAELMLMFTSERRWHPSMMPRHGWAL